MCGMYRCPSPPTPAPPVISADIGTWDSHHGVWKPLPGKQEELGRLLGSDWIFDPCYHAFFTRPKDNTP
jgi:hypothetical protein